MKFFSFFRPAAHLRPDDLSRLAARDLPERHAQAVRRHLAACSACRADWQAVESVWQAAQNANGVLVPLTAPDALRERIWAALPPPAARVPERKPIMPVVFVRPVLGASLVIAALLGAGTFYGPALVFRAPRAVAFQDVENAMAEIKTATWKETFLVTRRLPFKNNKNSAVPRRIIRRRTKIENFMQANPARIASLSRITVTPPGEEFMLGMTKSIYDGKFGISFSTDGSHYSKYEDQSRNGDTFHSGEEMVRRAVLFPRTGLDAGTIQVDSPSKQSRWDSLPVTLAGKTVVRLQNRTVHILGGLRNKRSPHPTTLMTENTFWVDPVTYRIVRREVHTWYHAEDDLDIKTTCDNYRYNVDLPRGIFDVPPSGGQR